MQTSGIRKDSAVGAARLTDELLAFVRTVMRSGQGPFLTVVEELGLSLTQAKALWILDGCTGELSSSALADRLGLSPAATSRAADDLFRRGLLSRHEAEHDRRMKLLGLTAKGRRAVEAMDEARRQGADEWVSSLTPSQRSRASASLAPLLELVAEVSADRNMKAGR
jgi:DNA-binding MarR family transcriptional regulator